MAMVVCTRMEMGMGMGEAECREALPWARGMEFGLSARCGGLTIHGVFVNDVEWSEPEVM